MIKFKRLVSGLFLCLFINNLDAMSVKKKNASNSLGIASGVVAGIAVAGMIVNTSHRFFPNRFSSLWVSLWGGAIGGFASGVGVKLLVEKSLNSIMSAMGVLDPDEFLEKIKRDVQTISLDSFVCNKLTDLEEIKINAECSFRSKWPLVLAVDNANYMIKSLKLNLLDIYKVKRRVAFIESEVSQNSTFKYDQKFNDCLLRDIKDLEYHINDLMKIIEERVRIVVSSDDYKEQCIDYFQYKENVEIKNNNDNNIEQEKKGFIKAQL